MRSQFGDDSCCGNGQLPEWPNGADCNSAVFRLRWFESITAHERKFKLQISGIFAISESRSKVYFGYVERSKNLAIFEENCGSSSVDRALAFQAEGRGFEPRLPLHSKDAMLSVFFFKYTPCD